MIGDSLQVLGNHQHIHRHIGFVSIFFQKFDDFPFDTLKKGINQVISLFKGFCGFGIALDESANCIFNHRFYICHHRRKVFAHKTVIRCLQTQGQIGNVRRLIAHPLQIGHNLQRRRDMAQITGNRLLL